MQVIENTGAGEGNRTLVFSLEGCCSTIELHPRRDPGDRPGAWTSENRHRFYRVSRVSPNTPRRQPQLPSPLAEIRLFPRQPETGGLTRADSSPIFVVPLIMKGGDPVSFSKRCHLAGIAR